MMTKRKLCLSKLCDIDDDDESPAIFIKMTKKPRKIDTNLDEHLSAKNYVIVFSL